MLSNAAAAESENSSDPQQFLNWKGKAAAHLLLPDLLLSKEYRINKKQKEAMTEETELEMLRRRNEFLREEEKRLADRLEKLQNYLSLIKQKKSDFSSIQ